MKTKILTLIVMITLVICAIPSNAIIFLGGFNTGKLTYWMHSNVTSNSSYKTIVSDSAKQWSAASTKVSLTNSQAKGSNGAPTAKVMVGFYKSSDPNLLGQTVPYKSWTGNSASVATKNQSWVKASVQVYYNNLPKADQKRMTATHEFGHALSIGHPSANDNKKYPGYKVMQQGLYTDYKLKAYDKAMLKSKWGS